MDHLSYSAVRTYRRCPRQFYFQYVMRYKPVEEAVSLQKGALFHELLAKYHSEIEPDYSGIMEQYITLDKENNGSYEEEILRVLGTFVGYSECEQGKLPIGKTEVEFTYRDVLYNLDIKGVIDYMGEDCLAEHKLTGHPDLYTPLSTRLQVGLYLLVHPHIEKAIINCITPPGLKRSKKGSGEPRKVFVDRIYEAFRAEPGRYVTRNIYNAKEYNLADVAETYRIIWEDIQGKLQAKNSRMAFWQEDSACYFPSPCEFLPCCETGADPDEIVGVFIKKAVDRGKLE